MAREIRRRQKISPSILYFFMFGRCDVVDFREVTVALIEVDPITYDKDIFDLFSEVVSFNLHFPAGFLVQKGADLYGAGIRKGQPFFQELERPSAIDDIFNDEHILSLNRNFNVLADLN